MKAVILAGGLGTRISEETTVRPKPMIEIGGMPILWHIMKIYSTYGINEFILCCGYKGYLIKEYFANYFLHNSDVTLDISQNKMDVHQKFVEPWKITLVDTGINTMTGGRLKRVRKYLDNDTFCFTYGDGLANVNISKLISFHKEVGTLVTLTAVQPTGRFGILRMDGDHVEHFVEKPHGDGNWVNGGFFVVEPKAFEYIDGDNSVWEREPLERLAREGELSAYKHEGFWHPLDTLRDKNHLDELWNSKPPWKIW